MQLLYQGKSYSFRSAGLARFIRILAAASDQGEAGWVSLADLQSHMPALSPRQLGRFVDMLAEEDLPLIEYETKTRGRYRLAVAPGAIALRGLGGETKSAEVHERGDASAMQALPVYARAAWGTWVLGLSHAYLALLNGQITGEQGALHYLETAAQGANELPPGPDSVVLVYRAHSLVRASRYREALHLLRRAETLARQGVAHPSVSVRAQLIRSKILYDQGRIDQAARRLHALTTAPFTRSHPQLLNMRALIAGKTAQRESSPSDGAVLLGEALHSLLEAVGGIFLGDGDAALLDGLTYNYANNLLRGVQKSWLPDECAGIAVQWLAINLLLCRKLGIGDDTHLANLLLIDAMLDYRVSADGWHPILRQGLRFIDDPEEFLETTLIQSREVGNRLEMAHCLQRLMRVSEDSGRAWAAYIEAAGLYDTLGRTDSLAEMAGHWRKRFGTKPPAR